MAISSITITGVDGFVGKHVASLAKKNGLTVKGVGRAKNAPSDLVDDLDEYYSADLRISFPESAISDAIIHLAGLSAVGKSFEAPQEYINANSSMVTQLCETILSASNKTNTRIIAVSTGAVYAPPKPNHVLQETDPLSFSSPYVVSKILVENQIEYYKNRGLNAIVARPFNHIGPGQQPGFLLPDLWNRLQELKPGESLRVGNVDTSRDYLDVRDVAQAYILLASSEKLHDSLFNIASGNSISGREILNMLCNNSKKSTPEILVDTKLFRPTDAPKIVGSSSRLEKQTGWKPRYSITDSIIDFIEEI